MFSRDACDRAADLPPRADAGTARRDRRPSASGGARSARAGARSAARCFATDARAHGDAGLRRLYRRPQYPRTRPSPTCSARCRSPRTCWATTRLYADRARSAACRTDQSLPENHRRRTSRSPAPSASSNSPYRSRDSRAAFATNCSNPTLTTSSAELARASAPSANSLHIDFIGADRHFGRQRDGGAEQSRRQERHAVWLLDDRACAACAGG